MFNNVCVFKNAQLIILMLTSVSFQNRLRVLQLVGDHANGSIIAQ